MSPRISIRLLTGQSDQRLVALAREDHERAFEALVQRYRRPLLRYCRRSMNLSDARAEDVLQQALLQAWLALAAGSEVRDLKPWLYRIVHNAAVNTMRSSSESHSELTDAIDAKTAAAGESDLDRRIAVHDALSEVAALPSMQRQAMFLTAVDGQSHEEVASALGISHGAVRGLLYRARSTLRSAAAAVTPQSLIAWASGGAGGGAPTAERLAELSAGGGAVGATGLLLKGAVVAVTAGALATGATVVSLHQHARRSSARASSAVAVSSAGNPGSTEPPAVLATSSITGAGAVADSNGAQPGARNRASGLARGARPMTARGRRVLAASPSFAENRGEGSMRLDQSARHGDGDGGGGSGEQSKLSAGGPPGHGSGVDGARGPGSSGGGSGGSGDGSSDGSAGPEPESPPLAAQSEPAQTLTPEAPAGDHGAPSAEPPRKTEG